ncbi:MAG: hypothetical protein WKF75_01335 [Singulisphaera sp.]
MIVFWRRSLSAWYSARAGWVPPLDELGQVFRLDRAGEDAVQE